MKITKSRLKEIIKEEVEKVVKEGLEDSEAGSRHYQNVKRKERILKTDDALKGKDSAVLTKDEVEQLPPNVQEHVEDNIIFQPNEGPQTEFLAASEREVFYGGARGGGSDKVFQENQRTVTTSYSLTSGYSAVSVGPVTVSAGATVTIPGTQRWVVL